MHGMDIGHIGHLGGKRDATDARDFAYTPPAALSLPTQVDLKERCGGVYNQLPLHSCSAHALASLLTFVGNVEDRPIPLPSRLFIYYNTRQLEGTLPADDGATIRSAIKTVVSQGACGEELWPYDVAQAAAQPPPHCYEAAKTTRALSYYRIAQNLDHLRATLAEGYAFIFGMQAYAQSFIAAQNSGVLSMPAAGETLMGGHAVMAVGYDSAARTITALNSLGASWGNAGYFTIPFAFFTDDKLSYDFWTIRSVS